jgi:hypothetical protein
VSHLITVDASALRARERMLKKYGASLFRSGLLKHGLTFDDRFGSPHARPEIAIERDSRIAFARLIREIGMDVSPPSDTRPNALPANRV